MCDEGAEGVRGRCVLLLLLHTQHSAPLTPAAPQSRPAAVSHTFCVAGTRNVGTLTVRFARWNSLAADRKSSVFPPVWGGTGRRGE